MVEPPQQWPVAVLCDVLAVSRSGFSPSVHRHATAPGEATEAGLVARGKAMAAQTRDRDGSRRRAPPRHADGCAVGRYKARRVLPQAAVIVQRRPQRPPVTTDSRHRSGGAPNLLARQCDGAPPHPVWAGDIPDVWTTEGG